MRDKIRIGELEVDNISLDKKVAFLEIGHKYLKIDDPSKVFTSVTTLLKEFKEPFDPLAVSKLVTEKVTSKYYGKDPWEVADAWSAYGKLKSGEGTLLHAYGEDLWNNVHVEIPPDLPKAQWVPQIIAHLKEDGYELATTELLVYSDELALAGQSDMILKKKVDGVYQYMVFDWKFLSKPLEKKSFYNPKARRFKKMSGPFKHLMDCSWIHYSIQLAMYQTLTGDPFKIKEKVQVIVYDTGYELVPSYPMRVFWDENLNLQAVYEIYTGEFYDSRIDKIIKNWPADIKGR
jgi:hypothetical protein